MNDSHVSSKDSSTGVILVKVYKIDGKFDQPEHVLEAGRGEEGG